MGRMPSILLLVWACTLQVAVAATHVASRAQTKAAGTQQKQDYNSGEYLYRVFCASCHGDRGAGDGTVANILRVPPSNLTQISARNNGAFPHDRVYAAIDGRENVRGHGVAQMPIWGDVLKVTEGQNEAVIRKRISALVSYVETIQVKAQ